MSSRRPASDRPIVDRPATDRLVADRPDGGRTVANRPASDRHAARSVVLTVLFVVGAVMTLFGAAVYILRWPPSLYIYMVGTVMVAIAQVLSPLQTQTTVLSRLRRQQLMGALFLIVSAACMLFTHGGEWIVALSIAAVLQLYTAIRIPQEEAKAKKQKNDINPA